MNIMDKKSKLIYIDLCRYKRSYIEASDFRYNSR
jgi:hypothetical protein